MSLSVGSQVRLIGIPSKLPIDEMETRSVFEKCVGQTFTIESFNIAGMAELCVEKATGRIGETIWVEEQYLHIL